MLMNDLLTYDWRFVLLAADAGSVKVSCEEARSAEHLADNLQQQCTLVSVAETSQVIPGVTNSPLSSTTAAGMPPNVEQLRQLLALLSKKNDRQLVVTDELQNSISKVNSSSWLLLLCLWYLFYMFRSKSFGFPTNQIRRVTAWVIKYEIFLHWMPQQWRVWHMKFGTRVAWGWGWCPNIETCIVCACAEKACDVTLDDEKYKLSRRGAVRIDRTCIVVMVFCNQPEAFTSDLGDDQSLYLLTVIRFVCGFVHGSMVKMKDLCWCLGFSSVQSCIPTNHKCAQYIQCVQKKVIPWITYDENAKSERILTKLQTFNSECICKRTTKFH